MSSLFGLLVGLSGAYLAIAAPTVNTTTEPEIDLIRRQGLAKVYTSCTTPNTVALTFDDGPYIYGRDIVDTLNQNGIKGTFFYNGNNWRCIYDDEMISVVRHAYDSGHLIASHTWAHLDLAQQSWDKIHDEMWKVEQALQRIIGVTPAWMRPPYGSYNDQVRSASAIRGQSLVNWDFDSGDSSGLTAADSKARYRDLADRHPNNVLTLNHEVKEPTAHDVLPYAIQQLKAKGYKFATVSQCLGGLPDYQKVTSRGQKDASWVC